MQAPLLKRLSSLPVAVRIVILGFVYWLFCLFGTLTIFRDYGFAIYWPAAGLAILGVYLLGKRSSPGIFIASFLINYFIYEKAFVHSYQLYISITAVSAGNTLAALVGARCLQVRVIRNFKSFFRLGAIIRFLIFVVFIPALITSLTGAVVFYSYGIISEFFPKAHSWFLADFIGILSLIPVLFSWLEDPNLNINRKRLPEFSVLAVLLIVTGYFIFSDFFGNPFYNFMIAYFTTPIYFWLALRFDTKAIINMQFLSIIYISYLAIFPGHDFLSHAVNEPYAFLQGFSILLWILILVVHSIYMERQEYVISLHKSEQDLRDVLANLPLSVGILNSEGDPEYLNKEFSIRTGLSISDFSESRETGISGRSSGDSPRVLSYAWKTIIGKVRSGEKTEKEIRISNQNREVIDFSLHINPLKERNLMVMVDITQRNRMTEAIRENERKLSSLIQNLQGMVYQCRYDRFYTMEFVSEGCFLLTGYLPSELIHNNQIAFLSLIHERFRNYVSDTIERALKKGESYSLQYQIITKSGELKWVAEKGNGVFGPDGVCRGLEGFIHDISDRVETLEALRIGEERYRSLFENVPISLWDNDYSGIKKLIDDWPDELRADVANTLKVRKDLFFQLTDGIKIVDVNHASLDLYGETDKADLTSSAKDIFLSIDPEQMISVLASFYERRSTLEERIMEIRIKRKKKVLSIRWFIMPGHEKDFSRVLVTILDITELARAEKEIRNLNYYLERKVRIRTEELGRANKELEAFSYSVSHDLKAPLRAIRGFSSLLNHEYGNALPEGALHYIGNVQKNAEAMSQLITDLLRFSRLGRKSLNYTKFRVNELVKTIIDDVNLVQNPDQIEFSINELPEIQADEALIKQVFANIFSNALKFSKSDQKNRVEISCISEPEFHRFCVSDQGIGFEQKHAEKIFKVFQRLHTSDEYEGSGVGLSLVQRIIHMHGGAVRAESEPGKGTCIWFSLPVEPDMEPAEKNN
jgi:PAS domain S-box-containing protein